MAVPAGYNTGRPSLGSPGVAVNTAPLAFTLATGLVAFGLFTAWFQFRGMAALRARTHVPSDELGYLRGRHRRRLVTGSLLALIGLLIAGAYLSGLELSIDRLTEEPPPAAADPPPEPGQKREMTPEQKTLVRVWGAYWATVVGLVFVVLGFAFADTMATRRYALQQYKVIREEHEAKLRRDLAVHKAQQAARRNGRGGGGSGDDGRGPGD
jgi:uncharacterized membrane protein YgcG